MDSIYEDGWIVDGDGTAYFRDPYELFFFCFIEFNIKRLLIIYRGLSQALETHILHICCVRGQDAEKKLRKDVFVFGAIVKLLRKLSGVGY